MRFPFILTFNLVKYLVKQKLKAKKRFPLVLMLEPLHACNLSCIGCGRIREYKPTITEKLTLQQCLQSVDESQTPVVSICGGEPLMYPQIAELVDQIVQRKRHIYLCTNGMMLPKLLHKFKPSPYLIFNIHLDGSEQIHDLVVNRKGVYQKAINAIQLSKKAGFIVCTNTTVYSQTQVSDVIDLFDTLKKMNIDGILISPGYEYEAVKEKIFLNRQQVHAKFKQIDQYAKKYPFYSSPIYRKFLRGQKDLDCTPWGNITRNVKGWKAPCYLITDAHYDRYDDFMNQVKWDNYGPGKDKRCSNCMVHSGFEATVALGSNINFSEKLELIRWNLS